LGKKNHGDDTTIIFVTANNIQENLVQVFLFVCLFFISNEDHSLIFV